MANGHFSSIRASLASLRTSCGSTEPDSDLWAIAREVADDNDVQEDIAYTLHSAFCEFRSENNKIVKNITNNSPNAHNSLFSKLKTTAAKLSGQNSGHNLMDLSASQDLNQDLLARLTDALLRYLVARSRHLPGPVESDSSGPASKRPRIEEVTSEEVLRFAVSNMTDILPSGGSGSSGGFGPPQPAGFDLNNFDELTKMKAGAFGVVYKARKKDTRTYCAIKQINCGTNPAHEAWCLREVKNWSRLDKSPFFVQYLDAWFEEGQRSRVRHLYIQMPLYDMSVDELVFRINGRKNVGDEATSGGVRFFADYGRFFLAILFDEMLAGVLRMHEKGIIHRDLKPRNILVDLRGERNLVKIADFGLSALLPVDPIGPIGPVPASPLLSSSPMTGNTGTQTYMAPEVVGRVGSVVAYSHQADIYSLGVTLLELFLILVFKFDERSHLVFWHGRFADEIEKIKRNRSGLFRAKNLLIVEHVVRRMVRDEPNERAAPDELRKLSLAMCYVLFARMRVKENLTSDYWLQEHDKRPSRDFRERFLRRVVGVESESLLDHYSQVRELVCG